MFSDDYDTSEKARVPAWTDRILWKRRRGQGIPQDNYQEPKLVFYGRAELKQSDHRPVIGIIDVQVWSQCSFNEIFSNECSQARVIDKRKRDDMLSGISADLGPSDGTVIVTPCTGNWSVSLSTIGGNLEEVVNSVNSEMTKFGSVRYSRAVRNTIWTQYREGGAALTALTARNITVLGVEWDITSCTSDWKQSLASELAMVSNPVLPLAPPPGQQFKKESAKLLSQLSQLSFEELKEVTLNLDVAPVKPPPPSRPAAPPCRPPPPSKPPPPTTAPVNEDKTTPESPAKPAKPSGPPPRPKPPPARPPPPPAIAAKPSSPEPPAPAALSSPPAPAAVKSGGGFSDLFSAPPDPDLDSDIPLSLSSDSLATAGSGEATPAPTKPPLPAVDSETLESEMSEAPVSKSPVEEESDSDSSDSDNSDSDSEESGASTPTNDERQAPPPPPSRPAPPPSSRPPPPGPPPRVPGRPAGGPPPPVPKR